MASITSITSITMRWRGLGRVLMRFSCFSNLDAGPRLERRACVFSPNNSFSEWTGFWPRLAAQRLECACGNGKRKWL